MIFRIVAVHDRIADRLDTISPALVPTLARLAFALTLLVYYWNSASLKHDGSILSASAGAFGQIFPRAAEAALHDVGQLNILQRLVILAGTVAEYLLPALILAGLLTRIAALGMVGFVLVQTLVDVTGHGVPLGAWLDHDFGLLDQRTLWVFLLLLLVVRGAGPVSADAVLGRMFRSGSSARPAAPPRSQG